MDTWQFFQNENGDWCWKHVADDGNATEGDKCFASRTDCIADAMRHGYLARTSKTLSHGTRDQMPWRSTGLNARS